MDVLATGPALLWPGMGSCKRLCAGLHALATPASPPTSLAMHDSNCLWRHVKATGIMNGTHCIQEEQDSGQQLVLRGAASRKWVLVCAGRRPWASRRACFVMHRTLLHVCKLTSPTDAVGQGLAGKAVLLPTGLRLVQADAGPLVQMHSACEHGAVEAECKLNGVLSLLPGG